MGFAVVPDQKNNCLEDTPFGINTFVIPGYVELAKKIGVSIIRDHLAQLTKWTTIEPQRGRYQDVSDLLAKLKNEHKLDLLASLDYTPVWASSARRSAKALSKIPEADFWYYAKMYPPGNTDDLRKYVRHVVGKYRGRVRYWETWNEPHVIKNAAERDETLRHGFMHLTMEELIDKFSLENVGKSAGIFSTI